MTLFSDEKLHAYSLLHFKSMHVDLSASILSVEIGCI